jgi:predicted TPR repeat methyltransferase
MIERCRSKGLEHLEVADAVGYLEAAAEASFGVIFAAQVIEHLPYDALLRFLPAARRALIADGLLVVETVNPHVPQALKHFWLDPTHQHPLFPEVTIALCRLTGFNSAFIWYPQGTGDPDRDRGEQADYAVIAQAPSSAAPRYSAAA